MEISILGAGSWGTAIAIVLSQMIKVKLWSRNQKVLQSTTINRENKIYLPNFFLNDNVEVISDLSIAVESRVIFLAVPTQSLRQICFDLKKLNLSADVKLIICCKGIEISSLKLPSEIVLEIFPNNPVFVFSGPSFAIEVASLLPCSLVLSGENAKIANNLISYFQNKIMKISYSKNLVTIQIAGAMKNVIALACGIAAGLNLGDNARAALVTAGMREIKKLSMIKADSEDFTVLLSEACLGDLVLTCGSSNSRNMSFGIMIGRGNNVASLMNSSGLREGIKTALSIYDLSEYLGIKLPVCNAVHNILYKNAHAEREVRKIINEDSDQIMETELS